MEKSVSMKVIIDKVELDRLLSIEKQHINCQNTVLSKHGSGDCCNNDPCSSSDDPDELKITKVTVTNEPPKISAQPKEESLRESVIVKHIRKRFQVRAAKFLDLIKPYKRDLSWDHLGIVTLFGNQLHGSSIFDLVSCLFYESKVKDTIGFTEFKDFLKKYDLMKCAKNKKLLQQEDPVEEVPEDWFFLGLA